MKTQETQVIDKDGNSVAALLVVCPVCECDTFHILVINSHNHLQCIGCGHSYCDGTCDTPTAALAEPNIAQSVAKPPAAVRQEVNPISPGVYPALSTLLSEDYLIVSPAYGRDYKNKLDAEKAFRSGEDWQFESILRDRPHGRYCSIRNFRKGTLLELRYRGLTLATVITV